MRTRVLLTAMALASAAMAQLTPPPASGLSIRTVQPDLTQSLGDGGLLAFTSNGIGLNSDATVTITYKPALSTLAATLTLADLTGSTDFSLTGITDINTAQVTLTQNAPAVTIGVRYKPSTSKAVTGKIVFNFSETDTSVVPAFRGTRPMAISLNLTGVAPEFVSSYAVQPNGNSTLLSEGDRITLPAVNLTDTGSVAITLTNRGTAAGTLTGVTLKGASNFALAGVPFPPISVDAGKSLTFSVRFTPDVLDALTSTVRIDFVAGRTLNFSVTGSGLGPQYSYELQTSAGWTRLDPNGTVTLPEALIGGDKTTSTIRVTNVGNADGSLTAVSVAGTGFNLQESPFLPFTVVSGTSFTVVVSFSPTQPGKSTGRLRIGNDNFNLEGSALGSNLTFSYSAGSGPTIILGGGTMVFSPAAVGQTSSIEVIVRNDGTSPTQVNSISVTGTGTTFASSDLPSMPLRIPAGNSVRFSVVFAPVTTGANTGTLRIDTNTFTLSASANPPAPLPAYTFQGASGAVAPQQQPAVGLQLNDNYPLALTGVLTLNFTSDVFSNDPTVQFAAGGRTVPFTIPANTRQALFANGATQVRIQTGTVAGTISLAPTFATQAGAIDLTPVTPPSLSLTLPQSAPVLLGVTLATKTTNTFSLYVTGYATGRSITQMDLQLTPLSGETVATSKISLNVDPSFTAWYQGSASQAYGSLFTATVPFTLQGDVKNVTNVVDTIQSVSVTLTNRQGVSATKSVDLK